MRYREPFLEIFTLGIYFQCLNCFSANFEIVSPAALCMKVITLIYNKNNLEFHVSEEEYQFAVPHCYSIVAPLTIAMSSN